LWSSDEAQAIKNPGAQADGAVKKLIAYTRIALTGTPIEKSSWRSVVDFDFSLIRLLGSGQAFGALREAPR